jgi:hypothetical protein
MRYGQQQLRTKIINHSWKLLLGLLAIVFSSCNSQKDNTHITDSFLIYQKIDSLKIQDYNLIEQDCSFIAHKHYRFSIFKKDTICFFQVEKLEDNHWHLIMRDMDYGTNNSGLSFTDQNKDGFEDIVWNKKWQEHAYLFNPKVENFIEIGEYNNSKPLKIKGKTMYYKHSFPIQYFWNEEKSMNSICGEFIETHSELFAIDENYRKISIATLDNFDSNDYPAGDSCVQAIKCYTPPYRGRYSKISIWNVGTAVDSVVLRSDSSHYNPSLDPNWITNYWQNNYVKLLKHAQLFQVRRKKPLYYFK